MAILRLEIDLDSDVYPELHASLSALRSTAAQTERLRQLAAAGLVWENVRIHGAAAIGPNPRQPVAADPAPVARSPADRTPATPARTPPRAVPEPAVPADSRAPDFIDLAIDAAAPDAPLKAPRRKSGGSTLRDAEHMVRRLPVLMDVVAETEVPVERHEVPLAAVVPPVAVVSSSPALPPAAKLAALPTPVVRPAEDSAAAAEAPLPPAELSVVAEGADDVIHLTSLAQKPGTRSRLMRMKEKGLFKNG